MDIKVRLLKLGKKQVDLLDILRKEGFPNLYDTQLSRYISGRDKSPQAVKVIEKCEEIISEWEK